MTGAAVPAFPGAEGFGANATGGRGGEVYVVTTLDDSGPGSFRDAVSRPGHYVVFAVGGVVKLKSRVDVASHLTIAGQTAPGGGITLYGNGLSYTNADHTVTRHLRVRMGVGGDSGRDAITIAEGHDMIFEHVSIAWGRDEVFSVSGRHPRNITIQDSIIAMGLHPHSAGGLIQTNGGVSILRCLYIDNHTRNPKVKGVGEFIGNVVYNWGGGGAYILGDSASESFVNVTHNLFIAGPSARTAPFARGNTNFHIHALENYFDADRDGVLVPVLIPPADYTTVSFREERHPYPTVARLLSPHEAFAHVVAHAGASRVRDALDRRLIEELVSLGTLGQIVSNEHDAPLAGIGHVEGGVAPLDTDGDGMPDAWERAHGLDPHVQDHNEDPDGDGYTNLEDYLNSLVKSPRKTDRGG
ncbi:pectate lyase [Opitutales bacterium ASA1]|nr:pectate lyase [Opitutales bacterium ASA1]